MSFLTIIETKMTNTFGTGDTASTNVFFGPIDVRAFDFYSIKIQNAHSAVSIIATTLQEAFGDTDEAYTYSALGSSASCTNWRTVDSGTFLGRSATIDAGGTLFTSAIRNNASHIRIIGGISTSDITPNARITICGRRKSF